MWKEQKSGFGITGIILIIAVVLILGGGGGFLYWQESINTERLERRNDRLTKELHNVFLKKNLDDVSNWKTYRNEKYGFEVRYPENMLADFNAGPVGAEWTVGVYDPVYSKQMKGEIPELTLTTRSYGEQGRMARVFSDGDVNSKRTAANIYFQEQGKTLYAQCLLFNNFRTKSLNGLALCNKVLSTFKFIR